MALRLPDKWVWDFWLVRDGDDHHIFYLQAPRTLERPRCDTTTPRSATRSRATFAPGEVLPDALHPGPEGSWDDLATWTGSAIEPRRPLVHALHGHQPPRAGARPAHRPRRLRRPRPLGEAPREPGARGRRPLVRPARPEPLARPVVARPVALPGRRGRVVPQPDHGAGRAPARADSAGVVAHARSRDLVDVGGAAAADAAGRVRPGRGSAARPHERALRDPGLVPGGGPLAGADREARHPRADRDLRLLGRRALRPLLRRRPIRSRLRAARSAPSTPASCSRTSDGSWRFMAFRGDGDRDFLGELTDPLPLLYDGEGRIVVTYPQVPAESDPVTIAPEIRSWLDWGAARRRVGRLVAAAGAPRGAPGRARRRSCDGAASRSSPSAR